VEEGDFEVHPPKRERERERERGVFPRFFGARRCVPMVSQLILAE